MSFGIYIVEYNRPDIWQRCYKSWYAKASDWNGLYIYYVDNGSPYSTWEISTNRNIYKYKRLTENIGPAKARNIFWKYNNDEMILVKADGDIEITEVAWDQKIVAYFCENPDVYLLCFGKKEEIIEENVRSRPYPLFFIRNKLAKHIGLFRDYSEEIGTFWSCDDIDYIFRCICLIKYWKSKRLFGLENIRIQSEDWKEFSTHHQRPSHLCEINKESSAHAALRTKALNDRFAFYKENPEKNVFIKQIEGDSA